jgi:uncharacterized integral membrane protein
MYRLILVLLFALIVAMFAIQNALVVDVNFLFWTLNGISLALVILGATAAGATIVGILYVFRQVQFMRTRKDLLSQVKKMEADLKEKCLEENRLREQVDVLRKALEAQEAGGPEPVQQA